MKEGGSMYTTLKEVLKEAEDLNMAIGAFNTHNLEMLPSIIKAAVNQRTPVIIQTSCGTANYIGHKKVWRENKKRRGRRTFPAGKKRTGRNEGKERGAGEEEKKKAFPPRPRRQ